MRLLFYSPVFPPRVGGIETIVYSIATGLAEIPALDGSPEFDITFVTPTPAGDYPDSALPFRIRRQPRPSELWTLIRSADVVHIAVPALLPMMLGLFAGKPVIVEHHGFQNICPTGQLLQEPMGRPCPGHFMAGRHLNCLRCRPNNNWLHSLKQWLATWVRRALCPHIFANIMPTDYLGQLLQLPNAVTIHHGIALAQSSPELPILSSAQPMKLLYQGRLVNTKGIHVLLEAAGILQSRGRDFELLVVGDGPERAVLDRRAAELGISGKVRFLGKLSDSSLAQAAEDVRVVVVPSLAGEVFGLVLAENMARRMAVVASQIGAFQEVLGDAGLSFPAGNAEELASQLEKLLASPALVSQFGLRAQQRIFQSFSRSQMLAGHAALYRKAFAAAR